ncbi:MAG: hypothetical protein ACFE7E_00495 [Candidatus Hodarchaeota archaeon]
MSASLPIVSTYFDSILNRGPINKISRIYNVRCLGQPPQSGDRTYVKYQRHTFRGSVVYFPWVDEVVEHGSYVEKLDYSAPAQGEVYRETSGHYSIPLFTPRYVLIEVMIR